MIINALRNLAQAQRLPYKRKAFLQAAEAVSKYDLSELRRKSLKELAKLPGLGRSTAQVIYELLHTGRSKRYEEEVSLPYHSDLLALRGVGIKTAAKLFKTYGIATIDELKEALDKGRIKDHRLRQAVEVHARLKAKLPWFIAHEVVSLLEEALSPYGTVIPCGSYRRFKEEVGDLDIIVAGGKSAKIARRLRQLGWVEEAVGSRKLSGTFTLDSFKLHVDILLCPEKELWAAVNYFTGSKNFNIYLRTLAKAKDIKINEKYLEIKGKKHYLKSEEELFEILDLPFVPPERREEGILDEFKSLNWRKLRINDFHVHSTVSDGGTKPETWSKYLTKVANLGLADHSKPHPQGVSPNKLKKYAKRLRKLRLKAGLELELTKKGLPEGYTPDVLSCLDYVVLSAHYKHSYINKILKVIKDIPVPIIIGHITGRKLNQREGLDITFCQNVLEKLLDHQDKVVLEINAQPNRLDPPWPLLRWAVNKGFGIVISSDCHSGFAELKSLQQFGQRWASKGLVTKSALLKGLKVVLNR